MGFLCQLYFIYCDMLQSFGELHHRPLIVDLTVEEGQRLKVLYGSKLGFHGIDVDTATIYDLYIPQHVSNHDAATSILHHWFIYLLTFKVIAH